ncbi:relaxase/mobilization nuclease domain-containing protein [Marinobacter qingdaonensis]|uniref:Relaxase/mobilization nuclease domain-containing protein n=1 Tax=Marinobacter qingdaonensis TaxID=3108486 RepID=A0ABU5NUR2_9GAMM|nr:relaxase/mobilization nuclease domain-containing protein [Marinobacter sp. ASW11-75]MEA1079541.1 relaxase/mobilization nuclease domain-containing protein [Marinobacter sp. ASW11-75]
MIHKKMKNRASAGGTLAYIYRGKGHDHQIENLRHICSTTFSGDPITRDPEGKIVRIDLDDMEDELEFGAAKNLRAKQKFAHYIISLRPNEHLTDEQWKEVAEDYVFSLGYKPSAKWTAAIHEEKDSQHVHIFACRVQIGNSYRMVSDKNDFERGMSCMRRLEKRFKLDPSPSPRETWGRDVPKDDFQMGLRAIKKEKKVGLSWRERLLAKLAIAVEESRGQSFQDFVEMCEALGVGVMLTLNDKGFPKGISYSFEQKSISGYHLKSSRLTFSRLTGMQYDEDEGQMVELKGPNEGIVYEQVTVVPKGYTQRAERAVSSGSDANPAATESAEKAQAARELKRQAALDARRSGGVGQFLKNH